MSPVFGEAKCHWGEGATLSYLFLGKIFLSFYLLLKQVTKLPYDLQALYSVIFHNTPSFPCLEPPRLLMLLHHYVEIVI